MERRQETIRIKGNEIVLEVAGFTWKEGDNNILHIPSINCSAYGKNEEEVKEMMDEVLDDFCSNLYRLSLKEQKLILASLGWKQQKSARKNYSKTYVDKSGILNEFDLDPKQLKEVKEKKISLGVPV